MLENIVIVGGGTAGWMTASSFVKRFPDKKITVIESPDVSTVGVGESTIIQFRQWLRMLDIKDEDFIKECDGVYKTGIRFTNFYKKKSGYFDYPFGRAVITSDYGLNLWYMKKIQNPNLKVTDYTHSFFPQSVMMKYNKLKNENNGWFEFINDTSFQFDAGKFAGWLKDNICKDKITYIKKTVKSVEVDDNGIKYLTLGNGDKIKGDLFIDCSGFSSILLGKALKEKFLPYNHLLPNNKAWATHLKYKNKKTEMECFTNCTAIENGWVWNIPLWSSIGTGYVYSDKFVSDEDALKEFKSFLKKGGHDISKCKFKKIEMNVGIYERVFVKNVCAIGLSAGFIEPLESNGLLTIHEFIITLISLMERGDLNQLDKDTYNLACRNIYQNWAEFVSFHYALSLRDDTPYWRDNKNRTYFDGLYPSLTNGIKQWMFNKIYNNKFQDANTGMHFIATGMEWFPISDSMVKYSNDADFNYDVFKEDVKEMDEQTKERDEIIKKYPQFYTFMKEIYGGNY